MRELCKTRDDLRNGFAQHVQRTSAPSLISRGYGVARRVHLSLGMKRNEISLTETHVAVQGPCLRWEIYEVDADGLEVFSHYATAGETRTLNALFINGGWA